jgi:release factor glutamine methyltransferase
MTRQTIATIRASRREEALRRAISPRDVDLLLADLTGRSTAWLFAHGDEPFDPAPLDALLVRRFAGEPLQYIRGRTEFYSREFFVDHRVLIPRPETEILVETAIVRAPRGGTVVDIGTGSGCIGVTIALERPDLRVLAVDASVGALAVAKRNRDALGARMRLAAANVLDGIDARFDLVISNPPYIAEEELAGLATEVRDHEPRMALTPGPQGTEVIERIYAAAGKSPVMLEIGYGQTDAVRRVAERFGYRVDEVLRDLAGIERVVVSSPHV